MKKKTGTAAGVTQAMIITPMLDMSFQILAFFIMTYHPSALEGHIAGSLVPSQASGAPREIADPVLLPGELLDDALTVIVKNNGAVLGKPDKVLLRRKTEPVPAQVADATVSWSEARRLLDRELKRLRKDADAEQVSIRIEADAELRQQFVIDIYDVCKNAGFSKIGFVPPPR